MTCYTEGFSHFVTSMTAPVASGWSGCRVGLAPTAKRRLVTAHSLTGHWKWRTSQSGEAAVRDERKDGQSDAHGRCRHRLQHHASREAVVDNRLAPGE